MNLLKKAAATTALVVLASSLVVTGASASSASQIAAANELATANIINDNSANPAGYKLDQFVLRQEIAAVARGIAKIDKKATCDNSFKDVSATNPNTWACYTVEALRDANLIAANSYFKPETKITKAESIGMVVKAACGEKYSYDASKGTTWQEQVVAFAVEKSITSQFTDYNALSTRGFVFEAGAAALKGCNDTVAVDNNTATGGEDDDFAKLLCQLDPSSCAKEEVKTEEVKTEEVKTEEVKTEEVKKEEVKEEVKTEQTNASVALNSDTPVSATVPAGVSGLPVAKFTFTAGSEDLTINSLVLKRTGLSDKNTLSGLAAFTDEGRVSKAKNDSQENDTEANITLDNGGVVIKAGESKTITIVADIKSLTGTDHADAYDEFAIELKEVTASSNVEGYPVLANKMKLGSVEASKLTVEDDSDPSNVKAGESDVNIVKFKLKGDDTSDILVKTITLKGAGSVDEEDEIVNYKLKNGTTVLAETSSANGKYVTFDLGDGFVVKEDKTEKFVVTADIIGGASKTIDFKIDKSLDITAEGSKYGYGASIIGALGTSFGSITINAGELTLMDIDAPSDKIRADKNNVELGSIKVTNVAGQNLELQQLSVRAQSTGSGVTSVLENFEVVVGNTSYELSPNATDANDTDINFYDDDLSITLPQGITTLTFRADTKKDLVAGNKITLSIATPTKNVPSDTLDHSDGTFYVVETEDDNFVKDLTPSSLTFKNVEVISAGATVAKVPNPDTSVVRGASDVVAATFEIEADEASLVTMDELKVKVTASGSLADNTVISEVALYKGSVSDANLLDKVSGSNLASGIATFEGFNVTIPAKEKENFVVTVSIVDGTDSVNQVIEVKLTEVSLEDDDSDDVTLTNQSSLPLDSGADITVTNSGLLSIVGDVSNVDNEDAQKILAGDSGFVFSVDALAQNEEINVEKIKFSYTGSNLNDAAATASLYIDDVLVATNSNSDITSDTITFENLSNLIIPTQTSELRIKINTESVGKDNSGKSVSSAQIIDVTIDAGDATGVNSGKTLPLVDGTVNPNDSKAFSVIPVIVTPSVTNTFATDDLNAEITMAVDAGNNKTTTGAGLNASLSGVTIDVTSFTKSGSITVFNGNGDNVGSGSITAAGIYTIDITPNDTITNGEVYRLETTAEASFRLAKTGAVYKVSTNGYTSNLKTTQDLGSYAKTN